MEPFINWQMSNGQVYQEFSKSEKRFLSFDLQKLFLIISYSFYCLRQWNISIRDAFKIHGYRNSVAFIDT